jgi:hypothetical protein
MTGRWPPGGRQDTLLKMVTAAPFPFEVSIAPSETGASGSKWELTGLDPVTGSSVTHTYLLTGREQEDYLDFFERLACDRAGQIFSTRGAVHRRRRAAGDRRGDRSSSVRRPRRSDVPVLEGGLE